MATVNLSEKGRGLARSRSALFSRFTLSRGGQAWLAILCVLAFCAIAAPVIAPYSPDSIDPSRVLMGLNGHHLLGSDEFGRDVLTRGLYGYRVSLAVAVGAVGLSLPVGVGIGLVAGYFGGAIDMALMR